MGLRVKSMLKLINYLTKGDDGARVGDLLGNLGRCVEQASGGEEGIE